MENLFILYSYLSGWDENVSEQCTHSRTHIYTRTHSAEPPSVLYMDNVYMCEGLSLRMYVCMWIIIKDYAPNEAH